MSSQFAHLGLAPELLKAVESLEYTEPTPIQSGAIPMLLNGRNVVGQAQTGTGKTAAFFLPLLQNTAAGCSSINALVLTPTRELAIQVEAAAIQFAQFSGHRVTSIYGGQSYNIQIRQLKRGTDIIVGTPGRIMDLMRKGLLDLGNVQIVVIDEADEMLDMGFEEDVKTILDSMPEEKQISLFSATFPQAVKKLITKYVSDPQHIRIDPSHITVPEIDQRYCVVREDSKLPALGRILEMEEISSALIFTRTKARAQEISTGLSSRGFLSEALHGDLNQASRESVLNKFRNHTVSILVATDVASRGLDINDLSHVINFDVPQDAEDYVHRIGRTGRAGKMGIAVTFITPKERQRLFSIETFTHQTMKEVKVPSSEQITSRRDEIFISKLEEHLHENENNTPSTLITKLLENGIDLKSIAMAAIQMARSNEPSCLSDGFKDSPSGYRIVGSSPKDSPTKRSAGSSSLSKHSPMNGRKDGRKETTFDDKQGMIRLRMNMGNSHGIRPGDIVGAIANEVGIPGKAIGEIIIQNHYSLFDVTEKHMHKVLKESSGKYSFHGKPIVITRAG